MEIDSAITLVATKLTAPTPPAQLVSRHRLEESLTKAVADPSVRVVLVSAPAGSGKSTLVAAWLDGRNDHAWLQGDAADRDPARFWGHVVAALGRVLPGIADAVGPAIAGSGSNPGPLIEGVANQLAAAPDPVVLVVDDYHLINNSAVDDAVEQLIELAPATFTLVLCTRYDPSLRLSRLRVRGQLTEIRADDLRFETDEAAVLLQQRGTTPEPRQVLALCDRTEGWAAGLVLAGMSLAASGDGDAFVAAFQGDDRLVVDYLTEEFLSGISPEDRDRLLQTAILGRLSGPLVDAVCGTSDGSDWLHNTATTNQLVISLDRTGTWYRYHHLLGDLLRLEAERAIGGELAALHHRAGRWHQARGSAHDAVEHYLAGEHFTEAADLIYDEATELTNRGQLHTVRDQIDRLGPVADSHAGAVVVRGYISLLTGDFADARSCIERARNLDPNDDEAGMLGALAIMAHIAGGDVASALAEARAADDPVESTQAMTLGGVHMWSGDFDVATAFLNRAATMATREGHGFVETVTPVFQAITDMESGDNDAARHHAEEALAAADDNGMADLAHVSLAHSILARTSSDDAKLAVLTARRGVSLAKRSPDRIMLAYALASAGDVLAHHGDEDGRAMLQDARAIINRCPDPGVAGRYLARVEARHGVASPAPASSAMVEDLTDREIAVLHYLPSSLSQRDIANELYVSLNTVKTHCRAIYRKLGVSDRKAAVQAARDVNLL
jgi:LuxR family maltose regulon positive regulatory protein